MWVSNTRFRQIHERAGHEVVNRCGSERTHAANWELRAPAACV